MAHARRLTWLCGQDYSQVVSAALVIVRSSGRLVGVLLESCATWTCTGEPLDGGELTEWKSLPSTTWTTSPRFVARSMFEFGNAEATVAAACSLPGEKKTVVVPSGPG